MTGPPERRSVHLFEKNIEIQYTLEKVENQKKKVENQSQFQPVSNIGRRGKEICSNTESEVKVCDCGWCGRILLLKDQGTEILCHSYHQNKHVSIYLFFSHQINPNLYLFPRPVDPLKET